MVYLYKKSSGTKNYYYLRASSRKGSKVLTKDIAYLGNTLEEVKKSLQQMPKHAEEIRKAYKSIHAFLESNHYLEKSQELKLKKDLLLGEKLDEVEACKLHWSTTFRKEPEQTQQEALKNFVVEFTFNTTSIEGNTISLQEARNLLQEGITPKEKTLREVYDMQNTERVLFRLLKLRSELRHELIIKIHQELMQNIDSRVGYRSTDVRVIRSNFDATPAPYVTTDMKLLLQWYENNKKKLHPLVLATIFHHKFEKIHPFMDGNGRTGRMLLNYILSLRQYPPLIIRKKTRERYLQALRKADAGKLFEKKPSSFAAYPSLVQYLAQEMVDSYWNIFL